MLALTLRVPADTALAMTPGQLRRSLTAIAKMLLAEIDDTMFGPRGELDRSIDEGSAGGGPFRWKPLSPRYLEWKARMIQSGQRIRVAGRLRRVRSLSVWDRTGAFRDGVVRKRFPPRVLSGKRGGRTRHIAAARTGARMHVTIDRRYWYWRGADEKRTLLDFSPRARRRIGPLVERANARIAGLMTGEAVNL